MKEKKYIHRLTNEDKIYICFLKEKGKIKEFSIQYNALIDGKWCNIMRIDTSHGYAHKHTFHSSGKEYIFNLTGDLNTLYTEYNKFIRENLEKIKENYLR